MPQLDRTTALALVDSGYMPLSLYVEMFESRETHITLQEVESPNTAPGDQWEKLERLLVSTTYKH
jgi:hypothetical protein